MSAQSSGSDATATQGMASAGGAQTSPLGDLRSQLETAVTNSLNQLPADSSPEDIFKAVRSAVQDTLKANGLDPSQIAGHRGGGHHHHHHAGGASGSGDPSAPAPNASASDPDGDGDNSQATNDPLLQ